MTDLSGRSVRPTVEPALDHDAGANAFADRDHDEIVDAVTATEPLFGDGEGVHVVVDEHWSPEPLGDGRRYRDVPPTERRRVPAQAGIGVDQAGQANTDANDLVQVKYEMLRSVQIEQKPISQAAAAFGFSRPTYYQAEMDFQNRGLFGLLPEKRGPRKAHKLTAEVLGYVQQLRSEQLSLGMAQLATAIQEHFDITVHPRSIERALARQEKKRH